MKHFVRLAQRNQSWRQRYVRHNKEIIEKEMRRVTELRHVPIFFYVDLWPKKGIDSGQSFFKQITPNRRAIRSFFFSQRTSRPLAWRRAVDFFCLSVPMKRTKKGDRNGFDSVHLGALFFHQQTKIEKKIIKNSVQFRSFRFSLFSTVRSDESWRETEKDEAKNK